MTTRNYEGLTPKQILKYFFVDIKSWVDLGETSSNKHEYFLICNGLCGNLTNWCDQEDLWSYWYVLHAELEIEFFKKYNNKTIPFNDSTRLFREEHNKYTNPERLKFINRMVEEL